MKIQMHVAKLYHILIQMWRWCMEVSDFTFSSRSTPTYQKSRQKKKQRNAKISAVIENINIT